MHFAFGVDTMLLNSNLAVVRSAIFVLTLPSYCTLLPLTVHWTQWGMDFLGQCAQMMCKYVALCLAGSAVTGMKDIVLVPVWLRCLAPTSEFL